MKLLRVTACQSLTKHKIICLALSSKRLALQFFKDAEATCAEIASEIKNALN